MESQFSKFQSNYVNLHKPLYLFRKPYQGPSEQIFLHKRDSTPNLKLSHYMPSKHAPTALYCNVQSNYVSLSKSLILWTQRQEEVGIACDNKILNLGWNPFERLW